MKIDWDGRTWQFEMDELTLKQAITIQLYTGLSMLQWQQALRIADAKSIGAVHWLMLQQNGVIVPLESLDFPVVRFSAAFAEAQAAELAEESAREAEAAPQEAAGPTTPPDTPPAPSAEPEAPPGRARGR